MAALCLCEHQNPHDVSIEFAESNQVLSGINLLANRTGGVAMIGAPADLALERVSRDLDNAHCALVPRARPAISCAPRPAPCALCLRGELPRVPRSRGTARR